ncbi:hypothetical protein BCEP27_50099 [Burkholderia cepacia]
MQYAHGQQRRASRAGLVRSSVAHIASFFARIRIGRASLYDNSTSDPAAIWPDKCARGIHR